MFDNVLSFLNLRNTLMAEQREDFRRKHIRYSGLDAEVAIDKHTYAVRNWDMNGIAFETEPDNYIDAGAAVQMIIEFKLPHETIFIKQQAIILRTAHRGVSVATFPFVPPDNRRLFERVLDNLHARKFLESRIAETA